MDRYQPFNNLPLLPPSVDLETKAILKKVNSANKALAALNGAVNAIPNDKILIQGIVLQEARLSSEIENIVTTNDELYRAAANQEFDSDPQSKEILRYREALWHGIKRLKKQPLSTSLFVEIVEIIKNSNIGIRRTPGTTVINAATKEPIYTPPEGENIIREKLANLERFIHEENDLDPLVKLAVMHYQFEAIHPFIDGNGRTGRIINILYLVEKGLLTSPILFLSRRILQTRSIYYEGLQNVTEKGAWEAWILYMLDAIEITATETLEKVHSIQRAMEEAQRLIQEKAPNLQHKGLVEAIFHHPYCKIQFLIDAGIAKRQSAARYLQALESIGILNNMKIGRENYYINKNLVKILKL